MAKKKQNAVKSDSNLHKALSLAKMAVETAHPDSSYIRDFTKENMQIIHDTLLHMAKTITPVQVLIPGATYKTARYDKIVFVGINRDGDSVFDFGDLTPGRYSTFGPGLNWQQSGLELLMMPGD